MTQKNDATARHYSKQWGGGLDFASFVAENPKAAEVMPARQLPWAALLEGIIERAGAERTTVFDAACGFGDVLKQLTARGAPSKLTYVGADIHDELGRIETSPEAELIQWDITSPLPNARRFDFIICRAAIHHTPDPPATYRTLASQLAPGGVLAISAYAVKSPMREAVDDRLREMITPMEPDDAFSVASQFTRLGRDLQISEGVIEIAEDLPLLGIKAGTYGVQDFVYRYFLKCWYNENFSERHCDLVNFDWYHPPYAYRFAMSELEEWATSNGLEIRRQASTDAQHYLEAVKPRR